MVTAVSYHTCSPSPPPPCSIRPLALSTAPCTSMKLDDSHLTLTVTTAPPQHLDATSMSALTAKLQELPVQVALLQRLASQQRSAPTPGFICGVAALAAWAVLPAAEPAKAQMRASGFSARTAQALLSKGCTGLLQHLQVCRGGGNLYMCVYEGMYAAGRRGSTGVLCTGYYACDTSSVMIHRTDLYSN